MTNIEAQAIFNKAVKDLKFESTTVLTVVGFRWTLEDRAGLGSEMIKIERRLQELTNRPIDLRVEPKKDKNKRFDRNYLRGVEKL